MLPLYIFSFVLSSLWYQDIANRAHSLYSQSRREEEEKIKKLLNQSSDSEKIKKRKKGKKNESFLIAIKQRLNEEIYHSLFLVVFNVQILCFSKIGSICSLIALSLNYELIAWTFDYIGSLIGFFLFCWQHSFFSFEYLWIMEGKTLKHRIKYFEEHIPYFSGFGAPLTLLVWISPQFISTGIYALTFPLFIIQAIESEPVYKAPNAKSKPMRIPVFTATKWIQSLIIWFCGNHYCCIRGILRCLQKCGKVFGI